MWQQLICVQGQNDTHFYRIRDRDGVPLNCLFQWRGGREEGGQGAGGRGQWPPSDNFLGALKFVIANVKYYTKYVKSSSSTNSKW